MLYKWGLKDTPRCDCGHDNQTAKHTVEEYPVRNIPGGMKHLHKVTAVATKWLTNLDIRIQLFIYILYYSILFLLYI